MADPLSSIPGISSGIDWSSLVDQIIAADKQPAVKMQATIDANSKRKDALEQFRTLVNTLKTTADALSTGTAFDVFSAQTAGTDAMGRSVASAVAAAGASPGTYTLNVTQLAQAQKTVGSATFASATTALNLTGRLVIGGQNVDLAATDTLADVRDKINAVSGQSNVQATLIAENADGSGQHLVLTGTKTGAASAFTPTDDPSNTASLVAAFGIGGTPQVAAQDAVMQIDGSVTISRATNSFSDAIPGVTLSLGAQGTSTLTIDRVSSAASSGVQAFVDAYNAVQKFVKTQVDDPKGALARDAMARTIRSTLSDTVIGSATAGVGGVASDLARLGAVGISIQKDGTLSLDQTAWQAAYPSRLADVQALFSDRFGAISTFASDVTSPITGQIDQRESAISTQSASLQGRIDDLNSRLDKKRTALLLQYSQSEATLGKLKALGDSLSSQISSLTANSNSN
jgi:flagellar hook-associated protein 2